MPCINSLNKKDYGIINAIINVCKKNNSTQATKKISNMTFCTGKRIGYTNAQKYVSKYERYRG
jgi:hypothetical protein